MSVITYFWRNFDFSVLQNSCGGEKCAVASVTCKQRAGINSLESHSLCTTKNMKSFTMIHNNTQIILPNIFFQNIAQWRTRSTWMLRCPRSIPGRDKKIFIFSIEYF